MPRLVAAALSVCVLLGCLISAIPATAEQLDMSRVYRGGPPEDGMLVHNRVVLQFAADAIPEIRAAKNGRLQTDQPLLNALAESFDAHALGRLFPDDPVGSDLPPAEPEMFRMYALDFDGDRHDLADVLAAVLSLPGVERAEPVPIAVVDAMTPDDPGLNQQTWLRNTSDGGRDIRALAAWSFETGDPNVVVAIADTGVDWQHPDLGGTGPDYIDGNIWINQAEYNGTPGVDDDGNGYMDDIRGWDFVTGVVGEQTPPQDVSVPDNDPMDYGGHGTAVAGCVAAMGNNTTGVAGVTFGCKVIALRTGYMPEGQTQSVVRFDWAAAAMNYSRVKGADVYNASWGSSAFFSLVSATNAAVAAGMVIVTAAGNDNDTVASYLANRSDVIAVAATTSQDAKASFSNYGPWVDVAAPGESIYTTQFNRFNTGPSQHTYGTISGTSFSSPITAGMAAMIKSANPGFSGAQVRSAIIANTDNIDDVNPSYVGQLGSGRINLFKIFGQDHIRIPENLDLISDAVSTLSLEPGSEIRVLGGLSITENWRLIVDQGLQILGGYDGSYATRDPVGNPTTLMAEGLGTPLVVLNGVSASTVIDGFLLTGGTASQLPLVPVTGWFGGGMRIQDASPTLRNLKIQGNIAGGPTDIGGGAGMALLNSSSIMENVEVTANTGLRGAIYIYEGSPEFTNLNVHDNISHPGAIGTDPDGGGFYVADGGLGKAPGVVTLTDATISGHTLTGLGGGIYAENSDLVLTRVSIENNTASEGGGGIWTIAGSLTATDLELLTNVVDGSNKPGGGMRSDGTVVSIVGALIDGNSSTFTGGGLEIINSTGSSVEDAFITDNTAGFFGSAAYLASDTNISLLGNTVAGNIGGVGGGAGLYFNGSTGSLTNSIVALNVGGGASIVGGVHCIASTVSYDCNVSFGNETANYGGDCTDPTGTNGNVTADPLFCDFLNGDYTIGDNSPAAAANSAGCGTIGADPETCTGTPVEEDEPGKPKAFLVRQNVPNPFNPSTTISFDLPQAGRAKVSVFDLRGRRIVTLLDEDMVAGVHSVPWDGRNAAGHRVASGVYLYEVRSGAHREVKKMGLVK